jgi:hypothetical protein
MVENFPSFREPYCLKILVGKYSSSRNMERKVLQKFGEVLTRVEVIAFPKRVIL